MDSDFLVRKLKQKYSQHDTNNFNVFDFISALGSPIDAMMYLKLFWPDFIEVDGMVFLKHVAEELEKDAIYKTLQHFDRDLTKTEKSYNLFEVSVAFGKAAGETTEDEDHWLATQIAGMWSCRLKILYPERHFIVEVLEAEETGGEIGILFYQQR